MSYGILHHQQSIPKQTGQQKIKKDGELQTEDECHKTTTQQTIRKLQSDCRFMWYQNICSASFDFITKHACDRQTDRQNNNSQDRTSIAASCGEKRRTHLLRRCATETLRQASALRVHCSARHQSYEVVTWWSVAICRYETEAMKDTSTALDHRSHGHCTPTHVVSHHHITASQGYYFTPVGERSIAISLSVCLWWLWFELTACCE